jgi:hypothetical protein
MTKSIQDIEVQDIFDPKLDDIVVTDFENGPKGWIKETVRDVNVFFNPEVWSEDYAEFLAIHFNESDGERMGEEGDDVPFAEVYANQVKLPEGAETPDW